MGKDKPWHEKNPWEIVRDGYNKYSGKAASLLDESEADRLKRENLNKQGAAAGAFADQGAAAFGKLGAEAQAQRDALRDRAAGKGMMSTEMLRQGLQQQYGQQRSMAAGASPNNAAMAARTGAMNMGRASTGMAGQATMAGLQEQRNASEQLSGMINAGRDQESNVALSSRNTATGAYGAGAGDKSNVEKYGPAIIAGAKVLSAMSDRNAKTDITDGDGKARAILDGLKARSFRYKDPANGEGQQVGVMAQDLERGPLKQAVINTPRGKMVDGAKLATGIAATLPGIDDRIAKLEKNATQPRMTAEQIRSASDREGKSLEATFPPDVARHLREALRRRFAEQRSEAR